jgi:hypothetical protein
MIEYFLQRYPNKCIRKFFQRENLLYIRLVLRNLNHQTPLHTECTIKYRENRYESYFLVGNSCNFKAISKSNVLKQTYNKGEK